MSECVRRTGPWLLLAALLAPSAAQAAPARAWDPARTWVFMVGVLEWQDAESFPSFPQEKRKDAELLALLRGRGVPSGQIKYLKDRTATAERIESELTRFLARTGPGDTLLLYYCGHGYEREAGGTWFASWDATDEVGWHVESIPGLVQRHFKGERAVLTADCCLSGALARAARRAPGRVSFAVLTSSTASESSTGNWTFTESLVDAFRGRSWVDLDGDGTVQLAEAAENTAADMSFAEEQEATFAVVGGFARTLVLAEAEERAGPRVGERVKVRWRDGETYPARIVGGRGDRWRVHYFGYDESYDETVSAGQFRR